MDSEGHKYTDATNPGRPDPGLRDSVSSVRDKSEGEGRVGGVKGVLLLCINGDIIQWYARVVRIISANDNKK